MPCKFMTGSFHLQFCFFLFENLDMYHIDTILLQIFESII